MHILKNNYENSIYALGFELCMCLSDVYLTYAPKSLDFLL